MKLKNSLNKNNNNNNKNNKAVELYKVINKKLNKNNNNKKKNNNLANNTFKISKMYLKILLNCTNKL